MNKIEKHFSSLEKFLDGDLKASCEHVSSVLQCYEEKQTVLPLFHERLRENLTELFDGMIS